MDFGQINPILLAASLMVASTPILLAALGEMVVERAGVLNLGVEGMMITGAVVGFAVGVGDVDGPHSVAGLPRGLRLRAWPLGCPGELVEEHAEARPVR